MAKKGHIVTEETKKKISKALKDKPLSEETKKKMSESHEGKHHTEDTKQKISDSEKGKIVSNETKEKMSKSKKNMTDETKQKMSKSRKGKHRTEETKQKLRISTIKYLETIGFTHPRVGTNEQQILDNLATEFGYNIIRQFRVGGFFLDGYIPELNLAIEVDERVHENQKERDIQREEFIKKELNCEFLRIKDY